MKITIISIGKFENSPHKEVFQNYLKRMKWSVELKELELKNSKNLPIEKLKEEIHSNIRLNTECQKIVKDELGFRVETSNGVIFTKKKSFLPQSLCKLKNF